MPNIDYNNMAKILIISGELTIFSQATVSNESELKKAVDTVRRARPTRRSIPRLPQPPQGHATRKRIRRKQNRQNIHQPLHEHANTVLRTR